MLQQSKVRYFNANQASIPCIVLALIKAANEFVVICHTGLEALPSKKKVYMYCTNTVYITVHRTELDRRPDIYKINS